MTNSEPSSNMQEFEKQFTSSEQQQAQESNRELELRGKFKELVKTYSEAGVGRELYSLKIKEDGRLALSRRGYILPTTESNLQHIFFTTDGQIGVIQPQENTSEATKQVYKNRFSPSKNPFDIDKRPVNERHIQDVVDALKEQGIRGQFTVALSNQSEEDIPQIEQLWDKAITLAKETKIKNEKKERMLQSSERMIAKAEDL